MQTLNACACPRCHFFVGYSTARPPLKHRPTTLIGACLNCGYRLPIQAILRGKRSRLAAPQRAARTLTVVQGSAGPRRAGPDSAAIAPRQCARELRAVGQALERLQVNRFNLRRIGQSYVIWDRGCALSRHAAKPSLQGAACPAGPDYRLDRNDIERIERAGSSRRSKQFHPVNGRKLSHLLRTLGAQVEGRAHRLLGIAWRDDAVSVVVETQRGRCRVKQIHTDMLYDMWVRMYLRRAHR